ncbi:MAG: cytochrome c [Bryobacterales bacterium]|nr:cytochrome c [Bryobacterales bacterium]
MLLLFALLPALGAAEPPTFYRDVLPVLAERCQSCHRTGQAAPMPLQTYKQTRPWAKAIRESVLSKRMPPWHADTTAMRYRNDLSLSEVQRRTLIEWVDGGALEGDVKQTPTLPAFAEGWRIAKPDVVFSMPEPFDVPAEGTVEYQYFRVPTNFTEDRWIEMAEVRPSAHAVVHHAIVSISPRGGGSVFGAQFLAGYAPGSAPQIWKPGVARLIPAGAVLIFQMHYTASGKPATDRTQVGLVFAKQPPQEVALAVRAVNSWFEIPPHAADYKVEAQYTVGEGMKLAAIRPHMHMRGKAFLVRAVFPDGSAKTVLNVPRYDFHWQPYYYLETPLELPAGTRLECVARYDNSKNNPRNPDPDKAVSWGEQSWEEMMIGWFDVLVANPKTARTSSRR